MATRMIIYGSGKIQIQKTFLGFWYTAQETNSDHLADKILNLAKQEEKKVEAECLVPGGNVEYKMNPYNNKVVSMANNFGYRLYKVNKVNQALLFKPLDKNSDVNNIIVYPTTKTVSTSLIHPKKGKTQLYRKKVDFVTLNKIFSNPRVHTNKGYYNKK